MFTTRPDLPKPIGFTARQPLWVDLNGDSEPLPIVAEPFFDGRVSPAGDRIAMARAGVEAELDIYVYRVDGGGGERLTVLDVRDPIWGPEGEWVYFARGDGIFRVRADGTSSEPEQIAQHGAAPEVRTFVTDVSPDGTQVLYELRGAQERDLYLAGTTGDGEPEPLLASEFEEADVGAGRAHGVFPHPR